MRCYIPAHWAQICKLPEGVNRPVENQKTPVDTRLDCQKVDKELAMKICANILRINKVRKASEQDILRCSGKNRSNSEGKPLEKFVAEAYKLSQEQGYLSTKDIERISGMTKVLKAVGSKQFRKIIMKFYDSRYITELPDEDSCGDIFEDVTTDANLSAQLDSLFE